MLSRGQGYTNSKIMRYLFKRYNIHKRMFCTCVIYVNTNERYRINLHFDKLCKVSHESRYK